MFTNLKSEILKNGGATLTSELKNANLKSGFMVSVYGYEYTTKNINEALKKGIEYAEIIKGNNNLYVGFWVDVQNDNLIYVDISERVESVRNAHRLAKKNLQKGIYSIKDNKTIYTDFNINIYTLYRIIRDKKGNIIDYKPIRNYDSTHDIPSNYRRDKEHFNIFKDVLNIQEL